MRLQVKQLLWRIVPFIVLVFLGWIPQISAQSSEIITLNDSQSDYPLGLQLEILEDQGGRLTIDDIVTNPDQSQFQLSQEEVPSFGYTNSVMWARFQVINQSSPHQVWYLDIFAGTNDYEAAGNAGDGGHKEINRTTLSIKEIEERLKV